MDQSLPSAKQRIENGYNNSNQIRHATPVRILTGWKMRKRRRRRRLRPKLRYGRWCISSEDQKEHQPSLATPKIAQTALRVSGPV